MQNENNIYENSNFENNIWQIKIPKIELSAGISNGTDKETLNKYTVYSSEVAEEMAEGLKKVTHANVCASVTGKAEDESGICKCDYCIIVNDSKVLENVSFQGSRNQVRTMQTKHIMNRIIEILRGYFG